MVLFPMILFLPLELGFVFSGFEETGFLLRGITYFPTYGNFVLEIQDKPGLRNVPGRSPVLGPRILQVGVLA